MRAKPKISKAPDGTWSYTLPAFGFAPAVVQPGFPSREAAGRALAGRRALGTSGQEIGRATPNQPWKVDRNTPVTYR